MEIRDLYWLDLDTKQTTKIAEVPDIKNEWHQQWLIDHDGNARGFITNHDDRKDREPNGARDGLYTYVYLMDPKTKNIPEWHPASIRSMLYAFNF